MLVIRLTIFLIIVVLAVIILIGRGDNLIAGYNTASRQEREKYNIKRLRICIGVFLLVTAFLTMLFISNIFIMAPILFPLVFIVLFLANTWAKK